MIDRRRLANDLTDLMARLLHYQERGEPDISQITYAQAIRLPDDIVERYRNEVIFHAQVERAVSSILTVVIDAEKRADSAEGSTNAR